MTSLVVRRALLDYARRPLNIVLLAAVPIVIVVALHSERASMSKLLSTPAQPPAISPAAPSAQNPRAEPTHASV
jgi:hypothetical protein